jgi:hypothetical protein
MNMTEQRPSSSVLFSRWDILLAILAGVLTLELYVRTIVPWVLPFDSSEFQVLAYQVGLAHGTGYPVFILLAKLFITLVPVGEVAYRVSLFSTFMGALTVTGTYLCARLLSKSRWAAFIAAFALAVSNTFWSRSIIADVHSTAAAFLVAVWLALLIWYKSGNQRALFAVGLCGGLGMGLHGTFAVVAPAVGIFLLLNWNRWKELWKPALLGVLAGVVAFLSAYAVVDLHAPPANIWNASYGPARSAWKLSEADIKNPLKRARFMLLAGQWNHGMFTNPAEDMPASLSDYKGQLPRELVPMIWGLALLGLVVLFVRDWRSAALFAAALIAHWVFFFNFRVMGMYVYYIPGYIWIAMLAAVGVGRIGWLIGKIPLRSIQRVLQPVVMLVLLAMCVVPMLSPTWKAVQKGQSPFIGQDGYWVQNDTGAKYQTVSRVVSQIEPNAIMFQTWDELYQYWYAAYFQQKRTDLRFIEQIPYHEPLTLPNSTIKFIRANIDTHPIYLYKEQPEVEDAGFKLRAVSIAGVQFYKVEKP